MKTLLEIEIKSIAFDALSKSKNLQDVLRINQRLSKRQRLTKRGAMLAFGYFKTMLENKNRRAQQRPYAWGTYGGAK